MSLSLSLASPTDDVDADLFFLSGGTPAPLEAGEAVVGFSVAAPGAFAAEARGFSVVVMVGCVV